MELPSQTAGHTADSVGAEKMQNQIQKIASEKGLSEHQIDLLNFMWENRNKEIFIASIASVSKSGMSRNIKFGIVKNGNFLNVTHLLSKVLNERLSRDKDSLIIKGCGMDMIFSVIRDFYITLSNNCNIDANFRYSYF